MENIQKYVVKENELIKSSYDLSTNEQRLILASIASLNSKANLTSEQPIDISVEDYYELFNGQIQKANIYAYLLQASNSLFEKTIYIYPEQGVRIKLRWLSKIIHDENTSMVSLQYSKDIIKYLSTIETNFTKYKLENIAQFQSQYSIRFYEWFKQYEDFEQTVITIEEIRERLRLENKYPDMGNFKKRVIDTALREINKFSDLQITYKTIKQGKSIKAYKFEIAQKPKQESISYEKEDGSTMSQLERQNHYKQWKSELEPDLTNSNKFTNGLQKVNLTNFLTELQNEEQSNDK